MNGTRPVMKILGEIIADLNDARNALRAGKIEVARAKFELVAARLFEASRELRS